MGALDKLGQASKTFANHWKSTKPMRNFPGAWAQLEAIEGHSQQWAAMKSSEEHLRTSGPIEGIPFETVRNYWTCSTRAQAICKPNEKHSKDLEFRKRFKHMEPLTIACSSWKQSKSFGSKLRMGSFGNWKSSQPLEDRVGGIFFERESFEGPESI